MKIEPGAIRRVRLYEEVASRIQRLISEGRLKPGDKLPPERELAEAFGVSRGSVRDAIRVLELIGLVEPRQGDGTIVRDLSPDSLVYPLATLLTRKSMMLAELLDVRKMIEPPLAARAASNASPEEIASLAEILALQEEKVTRGELPIEEDSKFHYTIATAARNSVALRVLDVLMDLLHENRQRSLQVQGRLERSLEGHRRILEAIRQRDAAAAELAMRQHIEEIQQVLFAQDTLAQSGEDGSSLQVSPVGGKND